MMLLLALACTGGGDDSASPVDPDCAVGPGEYRVDWTTDPAPPVAPDGGELSLQVLGEGCAPVDDLQQNHERMVHTFVIPYDLSSFQHLHQEDTDEVTVDDLRTASYHFPFATPVAGRYRLAFDFAHQNRYVNVLDDLEVEGAPAQLDAPAVDLSTTRSVGGLEVELQLDSGAPRVGSEAQWRISVTEDGAPVTDLVQYLGADAHLALISEDAQWVSHTHAWVPGMEDMAPGMEMPHLYEGPEIPFHFTFPVAGRVKTWAQFARASDPSTPITVDFWMEVEP